MKIRAGDTVVLRGVSTNLVIVEVNAAVRECLAADKGDAGLLIGERDARGDFYGTHLSLRYVDATGWTASVMHHHRRSQGKRHTILTARREEGDCVSIEAINESVNATSFPRAF